MPQETDFFAGGQGRNQGSFGSMVKGVGKGGAETLLIRIILPEKTRERESAVSPLSSVKNTRSQSWST
ncbi:MAG: hypothetical protein LBJ12_05235 [Oscillospiraceae bacterium]|jgi:hypothetical protein|nr:hypothetical protein [Oscillospiraceae bacterium]